MKKRIIIVLAIVFMLVAGICAGLFLKNRHEQYCKRMDDAFWTSLDSSDDKKYEVLVWKLKHLSGYVGDINRVVEYLITLQEHKHEKGIALAQKTESRWRKEAEAGNTDSQYNLAYYLWQFSRLGDLQKKKISESVMWYEKAAETGNIRAYIDLVEIYMWNEHFINKKNAFECLKTAVKLAGNKQPQSKFALALIYLSASAEYRNSELGERYLDELLNAAKPFNFKDEYNWKTIIPINVALMYATGRFGEEKQKQGFAILDEAYPAVLNYYSSSSIPAQLYVLYDDAAFMPRDEAKKEEIFAKLNKSDNTFLNAVSRFYREGIKIRQHPDIFNLSFKVYGENPKKAYEIDQQLVKQSDPETLFNAKINELFSEDIQGVLQRKQTPVHTEKMRQLIPFLEPLIESDSWESKRYGPPILLQAKAYDKLRDLLVSRATKENYSEAIYYVAMLYLFDLNGIAGPKDPQKALHWYEMGVKINEMAFYENLYYITDDFLLFKSGYGNESAQYLKKALNLGSDLGAGSLIVIYANKYDIKNKAEKIQEVIDEYADSPVLTNSDKTTFARMLLSGEHIPRDYEKGMKLLKELAECGDSNYSDEAITQLFLIYSIGDPAVRDREQAKFWRQRYLSIGGDYTSGNVMSIIPYGNYWVYRMYISAGEKFEDGFAIAEEFLNNGNVAWASKLAESYLEYGEYDNAISAWQRGVELGDLESMRALGKFYAFGEKKYRNLPVALELLEKYLQRAAPNDWYIKYVNRWIVQIYLDMNEHEKAFEFAQNHPDNAVLLQFMAECYKDGVGIEKNMVKADELEKRIMQLPVKSRQDLIYYYTEHGNFSIESDSIIKKDFHKARSMLEEISGSNDNQYYDILYSIMLINGIGGPKEAAKGVQILETIGQERNYWDHGECLAYCYENGIGVEINFDKANELRANIMNSVDNNELNNLAYEYWHPSGFSIWGRDTERAAFWFKLAFDRGYMDAKKPLKEISSQMPELSDAEKAHKKFKKLSSTFGRGDYKGDVEYALMLINGEGCSRDIAAGILNLRNSATRGNFIAAEEIGRLFKKWVSESERTLKGVPDLESLKESADASLALAICYYYGVGDEINAKKAFRLLEKAAKGSNPDAYYYIATFSGKGLGPAQNKEYLEYGALNGSALACFKIAQEILGISGESDIGKVKIEKDDYRKAYTYLERAASLGLEGAYIWLCSPSNLALKKQSIPDEIFEKHYSNATLLEQSQKYASQIQSARSYRILADHYLGADDYETALKLLYKSAYMGDCIANIYLSQMYEIGRGVKSDSRVSRIYFDTFLLHASAVETLEGLNLISGKNGQGFLKGSSYKQEMLLNKLKDLGFTGFDR